MKILSTLAIPTLSLLIALPQAYADDENNDEGQEYEVELTPLNNSGVEAEAELKLVGNILTIELEASGMEPGSPHPQHIHGLSDASLNATCPGIVADVDGDGLVSVGEGLPFYGPIVLPLTPFNLVDAQGNLKYEASFTVNTDSLQPLQNRTIVLHGMSIQGQYIPSLPIACGQIELDD